MLLTSSRQGQEEGSGLEEGAHRPRPLTEHPATEGAHVHNTKGHCHPRASSAKTRGFHTQLDEGPETP